MSNNQHHFDDKRKSGGRRKETDSGYKQNRQQRQPRPLPRLSFDGLLHRFMACIDCGYFLTAYRSHHGNDAVYEALEASNERRDGWLSLPWDTYTEQIVHRFFGVRSDTELNHLEFLCPTCQRKFMYEQVEVERMAVVEIAPEEVDQDDEGDGKRKAEAKIGIAVETEVSFQVELKIR